MALYTHPLGYNATIPASKVGNAFKPVAILASGRQCPADVCLLGFGDANAAKPNVQSGGAPRW